MSTLSNSLEQVDALFLDSEMGIDSLPNESARVLADEIKRQSDWIAKALPWMKAYKSLLCDDDPECIFHVEELTALIAQAEGKKDGENERI